MATTTAFGWETPDDTDLVKDGAAAIRTLGSSIDTSMSELKGGTTGQLLSKTSATDMDFTWTTPPTISTNVAGKNVVINSGFNVWQRGTSGTANSFAAGAGYNPDRWQSYYAGNLTVSRQATNDTTNLPFVQYCARVQRNSGETNTTGLSFGQTIETLNSIPFIGKTVTLSYYARAGANYSAASNALGIAVYAGTGTDQNVFSGFTGSATVLSANSTLTTTWQRFTHTFAVGSTYSQLGFVFTETPTGTAGANDYCEITGVQLEIAGSATGYSPATPTYATELAACQRYFARYNADSGFCPYAIAETSTTTAAFAVLPFVVPMRVTPASTFSAAGTFALGSAGSNFTATAIAGSTGSTKALQIQVTVASGMTAGRAARLTDFSGAANGSNIDLSAEL